MNYSNDRCHLQIYVCMCKVHALTVRKIIYIYGSMQVDNVCTHVYMHLCT